jgi:hypothetical protein
MNLDKSELLPEIGNLSLGAQVFTIPNLTFSNSSESSSPSLASLASEHLSDAKNEPFKLNSDLFNNASDDKTLDLQTLATNHITSTEGAGGIGFQIPSLFGHETSKIVIYNNQEKPSKKSPQKYSSDCQQIDLSAALNPVASKPVKKKAAEQRHHQEVLNPEPTKHFVLKNFEVEILFETDHWNKENWTENGSKSFLKASSPLGVVVCRRWHPKNKMKTCSKTRGFNQNKVTPFTFDCASPDDIIRAAQSQAFTQAFTRPK